MASSLASDFALAVRNHSAMDSVSFGVKAVNGQLWARILFKHSMPLDQSLSTGFEMEGKSFPAGSTVPGFHATKYANLFAASEFAQCSSGILHELNLRTGVNGHKGDHGVFFHCAPEGAAFYVQSSRPKWPFEPMCFIELRSLDAKKVKGGMAGRYCATGVPGMINNKVQLLALCMLAEDFRVPAMLPPVLQEPCSKEVVPAASPLTSGLKVITNWDYTAKEKTAEDFNALEAGYLEFKADSELLVMSPSYPGHAGNFYEGYVYAQNIGTSKFGWAPALLLHQVGCGVMGILRCLRSQPQYNGQVVRIVGKQNCRFVVHSDTVGTIAVKEENLVIFDDQAAIAAFTEDGKQKLKRVHPDKGGDNDIFILLHAFLVSEDV